MARGETGALLTCAPLLVSALFRHLVQVVLGKRVLFELEGVAALLQRNFLQLEGHQAGEAKLAFEVLSHGGAKFLRRKQV
jgi:hypothetical protein